MMKSIVSSQFTQFRYLPVDLSFKAYELFTYYEGPKKVKKAYLDNFASLKDYNHHFTHFTFSP